jgi:hypothetical protein
MGFSTGVSIITLAVGIFTVPLGADAQPSGKVARKKRGRRCKRALFERALTIRGGRGCSPGMPLQPRWGTREIKRS